MTQSKEHTLPFMGGDTDSLLVMLLTRGFSVTLSAYCSLFVFTLD